MEEKKKKEEEKKKKEEEKKMRRDVGKDKDLQTLEIENASEMVEVDETRQPCSLVFIGHVDAGKSTISGNLMFAMGVVDKRTIDKYKEEVRNGYWKSVFPTWFALTEQVPRAVGVTIPALAEQARLAENVTGPPELAVATGAKGPSARLRSGIALTMTRCGDLDSWGVPLDTLVPSPN
jgi:hypothetical protein